MNNLDHLLDDLNRFFHNPKKITIISTPEDLYNHVSSVPTRDMTDAEIMLMVDNITSEDPPLFIRKMLSQL